MSVGIDVLIGSVGFFGVCITLFIARCFLLMDTARIVSDSPADERTDFGMPPIAKKEDSHDMNDPWDLRNYSMAFRDSLYEPEEVHSPRSPEPAQETFARSDHQRTTSELSKAGT